MSADRAKDFFVAADVFPIIAVNLELELAFLVWTFPVEVAVFIKWQRYLGLDAI
jgi:nitrate reductase NapE component